MRLLQITVSGFRSLRNIDWKPGKLNVVIGPNGSGKSNLLRILEMMSVSAQGRLGEWIQDAGGIEPLLWDGIDTSIFCQIVTEYTSEINHNYRASYEFDIQRLGNSSHYRSNHERLTVQDFGENGLHLGTVDSLLKEGTNFFRG